jgi:hypothetical protein
MAFYVVNLHGVIGVVVSAVAMTGVTWTVYFFGYPTSFPVDWFALLGYCLFTTLYAFTVDRNDDQGVRSFEMNVKNAYYSFWAQQGARWATDPSRTGFTIHPGRRLALFIYPLVVNAFLPCRLRHSFGCATLLLTNLLRHRHNTP